MLAKMTKRARMTTEDVLEAIDYSDEDCEYDDPEEPFTYGSDDEFSDLNGEDDENDDDMATLPSPLTTCPGTSGTSPSSQPGNLPPTSNLKPVTTAQFQSHVGPTVPISDSPLDVFQLFFTTPLLQKIVDDSNR